MQKRYRAELNEHERLVRAEQERTVSAYDKVMKKVLSLQVQKRWDQAYKTLCYFSGEFDQTLPPEYKTTICNDIVKLEKNKTHFISTTWKRNDKIAD